MENKYTLSDVANTYVNNDGTPFVKEWMKIISEVSNFDFGDLESIKSSSAFSDIFLTFTVNQYGGQSFFSGDRLIGDVRHFTAANLKEETNLEFNNTKFDARHWTHTQKSKFQSHMFDLGYSWPTGKNIKFLDADFYFIDDNGIFSHDLKHQADFFFNQCDHKLLNYYDVMPDDRKYEYIDLFQAGSPYKTSIFDLDLPLTNGELFTKKEGTLDYKFEELDLELIESERDLIYILANENPVYIRKLYRWNKEALKRLDEMKIHKGAEFHYMVENEPEKALEIAQMIVDAANKGEEKC